MLRFLPIAALAGLLVALFLTLYEAGDAEGAPTQIIQLSIFIDGRPAGPYPKIEALIDGVDCLKQASSTVPPSDVLQTGRVFHVTVFGSVERPEWCEEVRG